MSNPDLVNRLRLNEVLTPLDTATLYGEEQPAIQITLCLRMRRRTRLRRVETQVLIIFEVPLES